MFETSEQIKAAFTLLIDRYYGKSPVAHNLGTVTVTNQGFVQISDEVSVPMMKNNEKRAFFDRSSIVYWGYQKYLNYKEWDAEQKSWRWNKTADFSKAFKVHEIKAEDIFLQVLTPLEVIKLKCSKQINK